MTEMTYSKAGVNIKKEEFAINELKHFLQKSFKFREGKIGEVAEDIGSFANVIDLGQFMLAMTTDGVGSKVLVAQELDKYDTIGIDLVAMLVNDLICLGAEPIAMVDYLALAKVNAEIVREIAIGIYEGAKRSNIAVVGGETATLPDIITGVEGKGFDLAGAAIGIVKKEKVITGKNIQTDDIVLGLKSSGIHSNGLTLARKVLPKNMWIDLLIPTEIYVEPILNLIEDFKIKGLANITGSGFRNLQRVTKFGFLLDNLPKPQMIFKKIQELGNISDKEMYQTFNMGIGFCVITDEKNANEILDKFSGRYKITKIGKVVPERGVQIMLSEGKEIKLV
jgi:phosphoribosylformylglycinamidine cyclo-ligase